MKIIQLVVCAVVLAFAVTSSAEAKGFVVTFDKVQSIHRPGTANGTWAEIFAIAGQIKGKNTTHWVRFLSRAGSQSAVDPVLRESVAACQHLAELAMLDSDLILTVIAREAPSGASPTDIVVDDPAVPGQGLTELTWSCELHNNQ